MNISFVDITEGDLVRLGHIVQARYKIRHPNPPLPAKRL
jgi:hypothetical protein